MAHSLQRAPARRHRQVVAGQDPLNLVDALLGAGEAVWRALRRDRSGLIDGQFVRTPTVVGLTVRRGGLLKFIITLLLRGARAHDALRTMEPHGAAMLP